MIVTTQGRFVSLFALLVAAMSCGKNESGRGDESGDEGGAAGEGAGGTRARGGAGGDGATSASGGTGAGADGGTSPGTGGSAGSDGGEPAGGNAGSAGTAGAGGSGGSGGSDGNGLRFDEVHRGGFCAERWCWSTHLPQGNAIRELFSSEAIGVWASTDGPSMLRWNGDAWQQLALPGRGYGEVWGTAPDDLYVALGEQLWHLDGDAATPITLDGIDYAISAISGTGPDDVWVATGGAFHFDGMRFGLVLEVPVVGNFADVLAVAPDRVWFLWSSTGGGLGFFDGVDYSIIAPGITSPPLSVGDEIWYGTGSALMRGNEIDGFAEVPSVTAGRHLFGTSPNDVYDVESGELWHFDGDDWTRLFTSADTDRTAQYDGTSYREGEAWTGGQLGRLFRVTDGVVEPTTAPIPDDMRQSVTSVWSDGERVYAVGPALLELDASGDTDVWRELLGVGTSFYPQAIWGSAPDDIWLVGSGERIYHFDGRDVVELPNDDPAGTSFSDVHGSGPDDIWAVGTNGKAKHYDGMSWVEVTTASVSDIDDVWVAPDGNAWAVGENGIVMRYTPGEGWDDEPDVTVSSVQWKAVTGTSSSDVWIAGYHNEMAHFDGQEWSFEEGSGYPSGHVRKLWALAPDDIWGASDYGIIVHYDGDSWRALETRTRPSFTGLWVGADGEGWAVGEYGAIVHRLPD